MLKVFSVQDNEFEGKLFAILPRNIAIQEILAHNNHFEEDDIGELLRYYFINTTNLQTLSLFKNKAITGSLPEFDDQFYVTYITHLALNNLDIYGSIPSTLSFVNISFVSLHKNRLSCRIPNNFVITTEANLANTTTLMIPYNLMECNDDYNFPRWFQSDYATAYNLFVTPDYQIAASTLFLFSCICFIYMIYNKIIHPLC